MDQKNISITARITGLVIAFFVSTTFAFANNGQIHADKRRVIEHWTPERMAAAIPRDLVIDERGLGYLRRPDGTYEPYGHSTAYGRSKADQLSQVPHGKPSGGSGDTIEPDIADMDPAAGSTIGSSYVFSANITDTSGIKSVTFVIKYPNGNTQSFNASSDDGVRYEVSLQGFSDGLWSWQVVAKDGASRGGNTATTGFINFTVDTGGSSGGGSGGGTGGDIIVNSAWTNDGDGGAVQTAAGRIYFEMPNNPKKKRWSGYVCSGTVANDGTPGRSIIITAAHCVYDDVYKAFARNVMFIPNQAETTGSGTDTNCSNDPLGCWVPLFGVVDVNWTTDTFPNNVAWDYAYYVVNDANSHQQPVTGDFDNLPLDSTVDSGGAGSLDISFSPPFFNDETSADFTHALGYSYSYDPDFRYCAEDMTMEGDVNWWLPSCELSGGSSGGPWIQPMDVGSGSGPIISVNSWGYTTAPGMAGPKLSGSSAKCVFNLAKYDEPLSTREGEAGIAVSCP